MVLLQAKKPRTDTSQLYSNSLITESDIRCFSVFLKPEISGPTFDSTIICSNILIMREQFGYFK